LIAQQDGYVALFAGLLNSENALLATMTESSGKLLIRTENHAVLIAKQQSVQRAKFAMELLLLKSRTNDKRRNRL
jgi:hypothetical protein